MGQPHSEQINASLGVLREGGATAKRGALYTARKVPEITLYFWIVKLLSTALGGPRSLGVGIMIVNGVTMTLAALLLVRLSRRRDIAGDAEGFASFRTQEQP